MKKKTLIFVVIIFALGLLLISCLKPDYENPFDPDSGYETTPMQGELLLTQLTDSQVQLQWQLNESIVGSYIIKRRVNNGTFQNLSEVAETVNTFIDTALSVDNMYCYQLIGANDDIQTAPIADSISTTFAAITNYTISQIDIHTNELNWTHACHYEEGYIVERCEVTTSSKTKSKKTSNSTTNRDFIQIAD